MDKQEKLIKAVNAELEYWLLSGDVDYLHKAMAVIRDIVNIGLHFFHKDVRLMLPLVVKHSIVAA